MFKKVGNIYLKLEHFYNTTSIFLKFINFEKREEKEDEKIRKIKAGKEIRKPLKITEKRKSVQKPSRRWGEGSPQPVGNHPLD